ncbi:hypothetical protein DYD21_05840 [Rhodohalobacter sp. SW132]|uniref:hypothetical protein n=1 Tax=Rhodohalobacter sp. SW132 TaxID=2293433 RepID=UPI000E25BF7B|nr:hypothetical protein [Rhodohalobacter sp. SW132]REL38129.1 hypothetical protein DYD21_05840 [Rhodohalobacter sp. SW132]
MNIYRFAFLFAGVFFIIISGCSDRTLDPSDEGEELESIHKESITGVVQKGPFISGSNVMVFELRSSDLSQTGRTFNTQIDNHQGEFRIENIELESPYVTFRADGFYFNEILGKQSSSQISLQALADVSEDSGINVNVMSHLEKPRIEYLISQGVEFAAAKKQAQSEILSIFHIENNGISPSEKLNIASAKEGDDILLAISSILQGYRTEAELSELLSGMINDLKEDGELNDHSVGSQLINHALYLNAETIRKNLEQRYSDIGSETEIPDFKHIIESFVKKTPFEVTKRLIDYPPEGRHGENILDPNRSEYKASTNTSYFISLAADLAEGTSLRVKISTLEGTPISTEGMWAYDVMSPINWEVRQYNYSDHTQQFVALESGKSSDLRIRFDPGRFLVEYFEMDTEAEEPAWSREFEVSY